MSHLMVSLAWCACQVFVVAALATLFSRLVMRRSPASAAAIALSGVLTAVALTLIVPIPIPASLQRAPYLSRLPAT